MTCNLAIFRLKEGVQKLSRGLEHILVNVEAGTWVKITNDLWRFVSNPDAVCLGTLPQKNRTLVLGTLSALVQMQILDFDIQLSKLHHIKPITTIRPRSTREKPLLAGVSVILDATMSNDYVKSNPNTLFSLSRIPLLVKRLNSIGLSALTFVVNPTSSEDYVSDAIRILSAETGLPIRVKSQGSFFSKKLCKSLQHHTQSVMVEMSYSKEVRNRTDRKGSYAKDIEGIQNLLEAGIDDVTILIPLMGRKIRGLCNIIEIAKDLNLHFDFVYSLPNRSAVLCEDIPLFMGRRGLEIERWIWQRCLDLDLTDYPNGSFYQKFLPRPRFGCSAPTKLFITSEGAMYPCQMLHGKKRYYLGNILDADPSRLPVLYQRTDFVGKLKPFHVDDNPRFKRCSSCNVRYFCAGSCIGKRIPIDRCAQERTRLARRLWGFDGNLDLRENVKSILDL